MANLCFQPGRYWGQITNQALGKTKTDKPQIIISFEVLGKVNPADPEGDLEPCPKYERTMWRVITDKTKDYVLQDLERLGFDGMSFGQLNLDHPNCCDLRGKECAFSCQHGTNQDGKPREEWGVAFVGGKAPEVRPLGSKEIKQLDELFGAGLRGRAKAAKAKKKDTESDGKPPIDIEKEIADAGDDSIPF